jgi:5-methyltetrahydropteroyltriglutamate--homocysteine methyltransferase
MPIHTTMTGSWFRPPEIVQLLAQSTTGELGPGHQKVLEDAERAAIREQVHPNGARRGLDEVSNGEQRKTGYTSFLPNRFDGFSKTVRAPMQFPETLVQEFQESNPALLQLLASQPGGGPFQSPAIESPLTYRGEALAKDEATQAARIAKEEGAARIFVPSPSPGVTTIFFARGGPYKTHRDYLFGLAKELRKEYRAILSVPGVALQIDAPDLAMGRNTASWGKDFYELLPSHVDAINEAISGLPSDRIRVHYCYGNYLASHRNDADFTKVLPEITRLKAGTIVGEAANPRHEGDVLAVEAYVKEHGWPKGLRFAVGVIDVKTPFVETPETIAARLERFGRIEGFDPRNLLGGTDCGFETFLGFDNVTHLVALQKLESLAQGAAIASNRLGVK